MITHSRSWSRMVWHINLMSVLITATNVPHQWLSQWLKPPLNSPFFHCRFNILSSLWCNESYWLDWTTSSTTVLYTHVLLCKSSLKARMTLTYVQHLNIWVPSCVSILIILSSCFQPCVILNPPFFSVLHFQSFISDSKSPNIYNVTSLTDWTRQPETQK